MAENRGELEPMAHGGRARRFDGVAIRAYQYLADDDHALSGFGLHVDIPDLADRIQNGNNFTVETKSKGVQAYNLQRERVGFFMYIGQKCANEEVGIALEIGRVQVAKDGVGFRCNATGYANNIALGPIDVGAKLGTAELGAKVGEEDVGLDASSVGQAHIGPVNMNIGVGVDTGIKIGKEGVDLEVLGTGIELGRNTKFSLFGSSLSLRLW